MEEKKFNSTITKESIPVPSDSFMNESIDFNQLQLGAVDRAPFKTQVEEVKQAPSFDGANDYVQNTKNVYSNTSTR